MCLQASHDNESDNPLFSANAAIAVLGNCQLAMPLCNARHCLSGTQAPEVLPAFAVFTDGGEAKA
jgi:hypothetical protein